MYKVTISVDDDQVYEQRTEALDLKAVIDAVNRIPLQPRKPRSDAGKTRVAGEAARNTASNNAPEPDPFG
jgi:hypothetical protein